MVRCNWQLERVAKWLSQGPSVTVYVKVFGPKIWYILLKYFDK